VIDDMRPEDVPEVLAIERFVHNTMVRNALHE